ncbi:phage portal protein family protein [Nesterenkonia suensis]
MATPPTHEQGTPGGIRPSWNPHTGGQGTFEVDPLERSWELQFPRSIAVFDRMRSEDGHVGSVLSALTLPVVKAGWQLDTEGVDEKVAQFVRSELGLPAPGEARARRRREGISWTEHVEQACHMLWAGFMPFEQVYSIGPARADQGVTGEVVHLRKLAPRLPRTIQRIETGADGGLVAVHQETADPATGRRGISIGVDRLVMYTHRMEGADWSGRSILRQAYKHWLIKDVLIRLDAQAAERNSMGIPEVTYDRDNAEDKARAEAIATSLRAGESAGVALPTGMSLSIKGVQGSTVDLIERIKYHDQEIARSALAMFLDLGHDAGARSLGETLRDVFMDSVQAFADSIAETATEHIVRDLVEYNFGTDEPYPTITPGDLKAAQGIALDALVSLVSGGVVRADDDLESWVRTRSGLPAADAGTSRVPSETADNAETAGALVRAGFEPAASAQAAGLGDLPHTGLAPVTVQSARMHAEDRAPVAASQPALAGMDELIAELMQSYQGRRRRGDRQ